MAKFDRAYLEDVNDYFSSILQLKGKYLDICNNTSKEQAETFKLRFVLTIGEDVLAVDDRLRMFDDDANGEAFFEYNDPRLNKYLEKCQVSFDSFLVRNQQLSIFSPVEGSTRMCFIQFMLHCYKYEILEDYYKRWKLSNKSKQIVLKNNDHVTQAILSEFLEQPPFGVDSELDKFTKQERETKVNHANKVAKLEAIVNNSASKAVRSVKEKQAIQELQILRQTDIEDRIGYIRTQINKLARKVKIHQKKTLEGVYTGLKPVFKTVETTTDVVVEYKLPEGWAVFRDENTGAPYYHNATSGVTQWTKP